uniref:Uncharacterized protein n=1 Tax=Romanomermis culicivorax TaxID=13658 RepID=A0A915HSD4_ROMCU
MVDAAVGVSANAALLQIRKSISIISKQLKRVIIKESASQRKDLSNRVNEPRIILNKNYCGIWRVELVKPKMFPMNAISNFKPKNLIDREGQQAIECIATVESAEITAHTTTAVPKLIVEGWSSLEYKVHYSVKIACQSEPAFLMLLQMPFQNAQIWVVFAFFVCLEEEITKEDVCSLIEIMIISRINPDRIAHRDDTSLVLSLYRNLLAFGGTKKKQKSEIFLRDLLEKN